MKKILYWNSGKVCRYHLDKDICRKEFDLIKSFRISGIRMYCLEIEITDNMLTKLFNRDLNHCELPNYNNAILLDSYNGD